MAKAYAKARRYFSICDMALGAVILFFLLFGGFSVRLAGLFNLPVVARAVVYFVIVMLGYTVLASPLSYYSGFVLSHKYQISNQKFIGWLADQAKGRLLGLVFGAGMVAVIYLFLNSFTGIWWLLSWVVMLVLSLIITIVAPVVLVPIFFKMKPLADAGLITRLEHLVKKAETSVNGIYVIDFSSKITAANAALMGIGKTRRIVFSDTLLSMYSPDEIEVITAHELGHHVHCDTFRLFVFQAVILLIGFDIINITGRVASVPLGLDGISDVAAFPLLMLVSGILSVIAAPLTNSYSRYLEVAADGYALRLTDKPEAFVSAMTRLTDQNLSVAKPSRWEEVLLYDHPSYNQRVQHARHYLESKRNL